MSLYKNRTFPYMLVPANKVLLRASHGPKQAEQQSYSSLHPRPAQPLHPSLLCAAFKYIVMTIPVTWQSQICIPAA